MLPLPKAKQKRLKAKSKLFPDDITKAPVQRWAGVLVCECDRQGPPMNSATSYLEVTPEQGARFFGRAQGGPVVMLNLLRFRERADYSHAPDHEPEIGTTGRAAYEHYSAAIEPMLRAGGGEVLFSGTADGFLIGPMEERWDHVMLVRQASAELFLAFASDPEAQRAGIHRTAALLDSRLLPIWPAH